MLILKLLFGTYSSVLYTEVSSFQGVGIEEFHYNIQKCLHFMGGGPLYTEGFHCIERYPHFRVLE